QPPSVLLVVFDTTRSDAVSSYGHVPGTTPYTDVLAGAGLRYANAYANATWTLPSHATLFSGLLPSRHGVRCATDALPKSVATLAQKLRARGYQTMGASENPWLTDANQTTRGFDRFEQLPGTVTRLHRTMASWL